MVVGSGCNVLVINLWFGRNERGWRGEEEREGDKGEDAVGDVGGEEVEMWSE